MNREQAIEHIWDLTSSVAGEFCCSEGEREELFQDTRDALAALGVKDA